jgi:Uma2 family endonuclease
MGGTPEIQTRRWKRVEYDRMIECGIFRPDERLELIGGLLVLKEPQNPSHANTTRRVAAALRRAFGSGWIVEAGSPIALDDDSEPEPDVSVVAGAPDDYETAHPARPVLVVEVSSSRLGFDRGRKASLYARAGLAEYWIVNLVDRGVEIHRAPQRSRRARYGWTYGDVQTRRSGDLVSPIAAPAASVAVADLLPRAGR